VLARNSKTLLNKSGESGTKLDEPIWAVIHLSIYLNTYVYIIYIIYIWKRYSEILCIAILTKKSFFFFLTKTEHRSCLGAVTSGREKDIRKGCRRVNVVEILCTYMSMEK
jgi:hypothetical protein